MVRRVALLGLLLAAFTGLGAGVLPRFFEVPPRGTGPGGSPSAVPPPVAGTPGPLQGVRIVLDPGHQLGNRSFPAEINRQVPAGGFTKACNTTGTSTDSGFPEATFSWRVSQALRHRLQGLGAHVVLTRTENSATTWGPCIDVRGRFGQRHHADLAVSIHGDGAAATQRGFHVIVPVGRAPWTRDIAAPSLRLGKALRAGLVAGGLPRSTYVSGALDQRSDLGTLNMSDVPIAMVELGNMRNRADAELMSSARGQDRYAAGLVAGLRHYLGR